MSSFMVSSRLPSRRSKRCIAAKQHMALAEGSRNSRARLKSRAPARNISVSHERWCVEAEEPMMGSVRIRQRDYSGWKQDQVEHILTVMAVSHPDQRI